MESPNNHYRNCVIEPIDVIKMYLTPKEFQGYLLGNVLKYRLRAGHKTEGDIEKAVQYEKWYKEAIEEQEKKEDKVDIPFVIHKTKEEEEEKKPKDKTISELFVESGGRFSTTPVGVMSVGCLRSWFVDTFKNTNIDKFTCVNIRCSECPLKDLTVAEAELKYKKVESQNNEK